MKALLLSEYKKLNVVDMPTPEIAEDEVLVRVRACGICGSDIHGYDGSTGRRIPPIVMGHEAAGDIAQVGKDFAEPGDPIRAEVDGPLSLHLGDNGGGERYGSGPSRCDPDEPGAGVGRVRYPLDVPGPWPAGRPGSRRIAW